jgi:hypothetical protein
MTSDCLPHQAELKRRDAQRERNAALKQRVKARMDVARLAVAAEVAEERRIKNAQRAVLKAGRIEQVAETAGIEMQSYKVRSY